MTVVVREDVINKDAKRAGRGVIGRARILYSVLAEVEADVAIPGSIEAALDDDLNTPQALAEIARIAGEARRADSAAAARAPRASAPAARSSRSTTSSTSRRRYASPATSRTRARW